MIEIPFRTAEEWAAHFAGEEPADPIEAAAIYEATDALVRDQRAKAAERARIAEQKRQVREAKRRRQAVRPIDMVATIPMFAERRSEYVAIGAPGRLDDALSDLATTIKGAAAGEVVDPIRLDDGRRRPGLAAFTTKARPAIVGAEAILAHLERKFGLTFRLAPTGGLVAISKGGAMDPRVAPALQVVSPLIRAHLAGDPLVCAWCAEQAVTLLVPDRVPACPVHAESIAVEPTDG